MGKTLSIHRILLLSLAVFFLSVGCTGTTSGVSGSLVPITRQFGSSGDDLAYGVAIDKGGNISITGVTTGVMEPGHSPVPGGEIFILRLNPAGGSLWTRQFAPGTGYGVACDLEGNSYVVGESGGDVILAKFDPLGNPSWEYRGGSPDTERGEAVAVGKDNAVYIVGTTEGIFQPGGANQGGKDIFLAKFNPNDNVPVWIRQLGSPGQDFVEAVVGDNTGDIYLVGMALGDFDGNAWAGGEDVILAKFAGDGTKKWSRQYGTALDEYGSGVSIADAGEVYVLGYTDADFDNSGTIPADPDLFLLQVDPQNGDRIRVLQKRSSGNDQAEGIACTGNRIYIAGFTTGDIGAANAGTEDAFVMSVDFQGSEQWIRQVGTPSSEKTWALAVSKAGDVIAVGTTNGLLREGESGLGGQDAFLLQIVADGTIQ